MVRVGQWGLATLHPCRDRLERARRRKFTIAPITIVGAEANPNRENRQETAALEANLDPEKRINPKTKTEAVAERIAGTEEGIGRQRIMTKLTNGETRVAAVANLDPDNPNLNRKTKVTAMLAPVLRSSNPKNHPSTTILIIPDPIPKDNIAATERAPLPPNPKNNPLPKSVKSSPTPPKRPSRPLYA